MVYNVLQPTSIYFNVQDIKDYSLRSYLVHFIIRRILEDKKAAYWMLLSSDDGITTRSHISWVSACCTFYHLSPEYIFTSNKWILYSSSMFGFIFHEGYPAARGMPVNSYMHKISSSCLLQVWEQYKLGLEPVVVTRKIMRNQMGLFPQTFAIQFTGLWYREGFFVLRPGITWEKNQGKEPNNSSWNQESWHKTWMDWVSKMAWWVSSQVFSRSSN